MSQEQPPQKVSEALEEDRFFRTDHLKGDLGRRTARGGAVTFAGQALRFIISTAATVVLARLLTPQDYGLIGMVAILVNFVSMFQYMGLSTATVRWSELNHAQVSTLFWVNVALSALIALVTAAAAPAAAWFYDEPRLVGITLGYAAVLFINGLGIQHEALLGRQMRFGVITAIDIASLAVGLTLGVVAALYGAGYWALVLNQLTVGLVRSAAVWVACGWKPGLPRRYSGVRTMLSFGRNVTGYNVMTFFARNTDNALIGKFWGAYPLGLYAKAYQMLLLPLEQISMPLSAVAVPALSRLADAPDRYRNAFARIVEKVAMVTMPLVAFMAATADWLVLFLLGPQWTEAARIFVLLAAAAFIQPTARAVLWLFATQGRSRELLNWGVIGGAISVVSIVAGLPWGAGGVAASYAAADLFIATPLLFWYAGRRGPVRAGDVYRAVAPSVCAAVCVVGALVLARPFLAPLALVVRLALAFVITALVSLAVWAVLPAGRAAIQSFKEMLLLMLKREEKRSAV